MYTTRTCLSCYEADNEPSNIGTVTCLHVLYYLLTVIQSIHTTKDIRYLAINDFLRITQIQVPKGRSHCIIILPVVLYWCETWSLTYREKRKMRVSHHRVLRRIIAPKRDEVTGEWRKLHNEELNDLYTSQNIIRVINSRRIRWAGHVARMERGEERFIQGFGVET